MNAVLLHEVGRGEAVARRTIKSVPLSPEEVGARIRAARELKGWSRFDLAIALEVSPSSIYRWEKGRLPSMYELTRLTELLELPADHLTEPPEHRARLEDLHDLLAEARGEAERGRTALLESLESIDARLSRLESALGAQGAQGTKP